MLTLAALVVLALGLHGHITARATSCPPVPAAQPCRCSSGTGLATALLAMRSGWPAGSTLDQVDHHPACAVDHQRRFISNG